MKIASIIEEKNVLLVEINQLKINIGQLKTSVEVQQTQYHQEMETRVAQFEVNLKSALQQLGEKLSIDIAKRD